jgi:hypothetical protein
MPTRFAKQLAQLMRGAMAIGMSREQAMRLAVRCARDSMPPLRLDILLDVTGNPASRPGDVRARIGKPWRTVKRELEALTMLGILQCDEETEETETAGETKDKTVWRYSVAPDYDRDTLLAMATIDLAERYRMPFGKTKAKAKTKTKTKAKAKRPRPTTGGTAAAGAPPNNHRQKCE